VDTHHVSAFDRWSYDRDEDKPAEAAAADKPTKVVRLDALAETRSQGEAYADTRQSFESGWERHRPFDAPRAELARFKTDRAGLPETSPEEAARYVEQHRIGRPWLNVAERASPEARRIMAAIDQGAGHGHIRHEGWVTEQANMRRAAYLEDPAQLDVTKQVRGIDGLKPNDKRHKCAASQLASPTRMSSLPRSPAERPDVPRPGARPVPTFEGGDFIFVMGHNKARDGYEIVTMHPQPPDD